MKRNFLIAFGLALTSLFVVGCSVDENPVTPEKMQEIRKKEADERANYHPDTGTPKPETR